MQSQKNQSQMTEKQKSVLDKENLCAIKIQDKLIRQRPHLFDEPKKKKKVHLSFEDEIDDLEGVCIKISKNPTINKENNLTKDNQRRKSSTGQNLEQLIKAQYLEKIQKLKQELIELEYSYWDGGDVVKKLRKKKKEAIKDILEVCRMELASNNKSLVNMTGSDFLFVINDFIIPPQMALYQIQALQLRTNKKDLLLNLRNVIIRKDGKQFTLSVNIDGPVRIIQRARYEKNKSTYPFCNWQTFKMKH